MVTQQHTAPATIRGRGRDGTIVTRHGDLITIRLSLRARLRTWRDNHRYVPTDLSFQVRDVRLLELHRPRPLTGTPGTLTFVFSDPWAHGADNREYMIVYGWWSRKPFRDLVQAGGWRKTAIN